MAYNIGDRFPPPPKCYRLLEPGTYQNDYSFKFKPNKVPFLSNTERKTQPGNQIWTHTIYNADIVPKIPNCTSMVAKCPRFPYEALSKEDLEAILCKCGIQNVCECSEENEPEPDVFCHAKINRRLYKGHPPRSVISEGLSAPSRRDYGFQELPDGTHKRVFKMENDPCPPFYDAKVIESSAFYQGCKWSHWKSFRTSKSLEERPGPADYNLDRRQTDSEICAEKVRARKRKTSKQLRFIEMIQQKNILEGRPGPTSYSPQYPRCTPLEYIGSKVERFLESTEQRPGPADHSIRRDFDVSSPPSVPCHAKLPEPSFFGVKAKRFKPRKEEGPSPASYSPIIKHCHFMHCSTAAFGSSAERFKDTTLEEDENDEFKVLEKLDQDDINHEVCPTPTWEFKSKTIRMPSLQNKAFEQSPAIIPESNLPIERAELLQYIAPFYSSEGRFQPWNDWISVLGKLKTPGPGYYNLEKLKCLPAVYQGPLFRAERFPSKRIQTPAPNEYHVGGGVETILDTHNEKLKMNIKHKHKFHWQPPVEPKQLSLEEQESILLHKSIALLDVDGDTNIIKPDSLEVTDQRNSKAKLLRCFLYRHPIKPGF